VKKRAIKNNKKDIVIDQLLIVRKKMGTKNIKVPTIFSSELENRKISRIDIKKSQLEVGWDFKSNEPINQFSAQ
jgi:hypothetical protein